MDFPSCTQRTALQIVSRTGEKSEVQQCTHLQACTFAKPVTADVCGECPLRVEREVNAPIPNELAGRVTVRDFQQPKYVGTSLLYPRTGWEPPVEPEGYVRDKTNQWLFHVRWPTCKKRIAKNSVRPCGCLSIHMVCTSDQSPHNGGLVTLAMCDQCPVREA